MSGLTSVVIVAADSGDDLGACVERVLASTTPVEVIVSDNASADGSVEALASHWTGDPRTRILRNGMNLGFGAGCNRGAAAAHGDALLFLNPDCLVAANVVAQLRAQGMNDPHVGLIGAAIVGGDGCAEPAGRRRDPLLRRALMTMTGLARLESRWPALAGVNLPPRADAPASEDVDAVSGALMLLPRTAFERIGGFDERYFLHGEDLDLCRRLRDSGLRVVCVNTVRVVHRKGTSGRMRPFFVARHKRRGLWRWFVKFDPAARNPLLRTLVWCGLWLHLVVLAPRHAWVWLRARINEKVRSR